MIKRVSELSDAKASGQILHSVEKLLTFPECVQEGKVHLGLGGGDEPVVCGGDCPALHVSGLLLSALAYWTLGDSHFALTYGCS